MKFKMIDAYRYWWPVTVEMPDADKPGEIVTKSFDMQFEAISSDESDAMLKEVSALPPEEQKKRRHEELMRVCKDWRDVVDGPVGKEEPVPFTEAALALSLQYAWFSRGLYKAYAQSLAGDEARRGN
ncbi:hypothetical protein [Mesorhizobium sp. WSM3626]|uniref:hypothetical protein n=1 Tax=Mesorhizobium sp. WSM3626 TaxID=1040987 RepID=UPI000484C179|nr:hypothetical protein [Mesorhizobium sp. WSM3626]